MLSNSLLSARGLRYRSTEVCKPNLQFLVYLYKFLVVFAVTIWKSVDLNAIILNFVQDLKKMKEVRTIFHCLCPAAEQSF